MNGSTAVVVLAGSASAALAWTTRAVEAARRRQAELLTVRKVSLDHRPGSSGKPRDTEHDIYLPAGLRSLQRRASFRARRPAIRLPRRDNCLWLLCCCDPADRSSNAARRRRHSGAKPRRDRSRHEDPCRRAASPVCAGWARRCRGSRHGSVIEDGRACPDIAAPQGCAHGHDVCDRHSSIRGIAPTPGASYRRNHRAARSAVRRDRTAMYCRG